MQVQLKQKRPNHISVYTLLSVFEATNDASVRANSLFRRIEDQRGAAALALAQA